ncbi:hypothetical protein A3Q56_04885 [Intoshia linei]|uniref:Uncharacterized protein n=1 Tax=Intoshia linei TaxID=1819745 RepID=A0A177AZH0_9BILA|nr:hypothetical protein A3Q56_04885 [Intoshia linei]
MTKKAYTIKKNDKTSDGKIQADKSAKGPNRPNVSDIHFDKDKWQMYSKKNVHNVQSPHSVHRDLIRYLDLSKEQKGQKLYDSVIGSNSEIDRLPAAQQARTDSGDRYYAQAAMMKKYTKQKKRLDKKNF